MVGQSDLPFRLLCRRYGADVAYTEMFYSDRIVNDPSYLPSVLHTHPEDTPLVIQLCGNDPDTVTAAALKCEDRCNAIDINLGCPQKRAEDGLFGAYLLDKKHWPRVFAVVESLSKNLTVPVFCKIRLCNLPKESIELAQGLEKAGCACLAVHGRKRGSQRNRRQGPADLGAIRTIREALTIPVIANGNVRTYADVQANRRFCSCEGIMSAEGVLGNPAIFSTSEKGKPRWLADIVGEYLDLCEVLDREGKWQLDMECIRAHFRWFLGKSGHGQSTRFKYLGNFKHHGALYEDLQKAVCIEDFRTIAHVCLEKIRA
uniref:tRNA-dihydrouridine synthase n=1 Tax=Chromera velia CCMP2878 TaxID=1169474 RepID=A0A0G4GXB1_9ALVE|eukprot:Cvel_23793.t1-p1 / transcript=Cvel_23793.t1 / gene=Cvel_23793 / organism=Chromera_velia_CCMP2878 / gene_product=tRNA-dihydrouridine(16/17) synthase, putative / transcript_product=tRNA-dihydrouridine(16/17) synthase, putative / location=Cvel_scaffold2497:18655-19599(-) / protein_length=315 / sequence_SO=supercontig / SO=protein_coding / is_pseudo=false